MKNFVLISPNFPETYYQFAVALKNVGFRVLGIGDQPYDELRPELKEALHEYYKVNVLDNFDEEKAAVGYFERKYGHIDYIESNNEYWLRKDSILRDLFSKNIGYKFPAATVNDSNMVALIPKNGIMKTEEEHDAEQGAEYYDQIIDENYILRDLAIAGEYNIKASYFYKHLRLNT